LWLITLAANNYVYCAGNFNYGLTRVSEEYNKSYNTAVLLPGNQCGLRGELVKKVVVVGAGVSGLTAAVYLQRSGFDVTVCEQNGAAGGMCTGWSRKGYFFEGAVHWMTGSSSRAPMFRMYKDSGALDESVKINLHEPFVSAEWEGQTVSFYRDIEKTAEHFLSVSPVDKKQILRLVKDVKALTVFDKPLTDVRGVKTLERKRPPAISLKMLPAFFTVLKLYSMTIKKYWEQFSHPGIRWLFSTVPGNHAAINRLYMLAVISKGVGGYPEGGSPGMIRRMTEKFTSLGGKLLLNTKVKRINIENKKVTGVTLENGVLAADAVIVTRETISAMDQLFDPPLGEPWLLRLRKETKPTVSTFVGVGIRTVIPQSPVPYWKLQTPIKYAGKTESALGFYNYSGYKGYAPEGCSVLTSLLMGDTYDFWKKAKEEGRYEEEKKALADQISLALRKKYPQLQGKIDIIDIATPLTYERYTGSYHGSWMTMLYKGDKFKTYPGYCKSAGGLYFAGHRIMPPGGIPMAVDSGRRAAQMVCRQFGAVFK